MAQQTMGELRKFMREKTNILANILPTMVEKEILLEQALPDVHTTEGIKNFVGRLKLLKRAYSSHEKLIKATRKHCLEYLKAARDLDKLKQNKKK